MDTSKLEPFLQNYRDSLESQRKANQALIDQQRDTDYAQIMSQANRAGVMYSNFPARTKTQYMASTYMPSLERNFQTYETGTQKIRNAALSYANQLRQIEEAIQDLNEA